MIRVHQTARKRACDLPGELDLEELELGLLIEWSMTRS